MLAKEDQESRFKMSLEDLKAHEASFPFPHSKEIRELWNRIQSELGDLEAPVVRPMVLILASRK